MHLLGADSNMLGILNGTTAFMTMVVAYFWLKETISLKADYWNSAWVFRDSYIGESCK